MGKKICPGNNRAIGCSIQNGLSAYKHTYEYHNIDQKVYSWNIYVYSYMNDKRGY